MAFIGGGEYDPTAFLFNMVSNSKFQHMTNTVKGSISWSFNQPSSFIAENQTPKKQKTKNKTLPTM